MHAVKETHITGLKKLHSGKVRDMYEIDADHLLIVTTDRISAFDVIMDDPIPTKGRILNALTIFWMDRFRDLAPTHLVDQRPFFSLLEGLEQAELLRGRSVVVKRARPLPVECIVRGYLSGSGWKDYQATGQLCGHTLPEGMHESDKLPRPVFTPSTKADIGQHDENITVEAAASLLGAELAAKVETLAVTMYERARDYAAAKGIIIADTKFEFGLIGDELVIIDEVLTPDSSRFWPADQYVPGRSQPSYDKQYLRDWLETQDWNKTAPAPRLPVEVMEMTRKKYQEAYDLLAGPASAPRLADFF